MPKKRRSLIGYVRPKKRALSEEEEALEEPPITNDLDPIPEEVAPMPPEASLSAMSIADSGSNDAPSRPPTPRGLGRPRPWGRPRGLEAS